MKIKFVVCKNLANKEKDTLDENQIYILEFF